MAAYNSSLSHEKALQEYNNQRQREEHQQELQRQSDQLNAKHDDDLDFNSQNDDYSAAPYIPASAAEIALGKFILFGIFLVSVICFITVIVQIRSYAGITGFSFASLALPALASVFVTAFVFNIIYISVEFIGNTILVLKMIWIPIVVLCALTLAALKLHHFLA